MSKKSVAEIAKELDLAALRGKPLSRFTKTQEFSLQEGYEVQHALRKHQEERGARIVGYKMGMTSRAKMEQMSVRSPIHGFLTKEMQILDGEMFFFGPRIQPKVEPEIAFILGKDIVPGASPEEVQRAIDSVALALEIIDSRYENYDFLLPDVVADNCSSSGFVVSSTLRSPRNFDYANLGLVLEVNGRSVQFGSSASTALLAGFNSTKI